MCIRLIHKLLESNAINSELWKWDWKAGWDLHKWKSLCGIQRACYCRNSVSFRLSDAHAGLHAVNRSAQTAHTVPAADRSSYTVTLWGLSTTFFVYVCVNCEKTGCVTFIALLTVPFFRPALLNSKGLRLFPQAEKNMTHAHTQTNTNTGRIIRRMACRVKFIIAQNTQTHSNNKMNDGYSINAWLIWWKWEKKRPLCLLSIGLFKCWNSPSETQQHRQGLFNCFWLVMSREWVQERTQFRCQEQWWRKNEREI